VRVPNLTTMLQPYLSVPRIPEDQPFVVQQNVGKRVLMLAALGLGPLAVIGLVLAFVIAQTAGVGAGVGTLFCLLLAGALFVGLQVAVQVRPGPLLAAGPGGVWIRTRPFRSPGIWLPWEAIQQVYRKRWGFERYLCFRPYDQRVGQNLGGLGQIDASMSKAVFGTGLLLTLTMADRKEAEILQAVAYYANGRVNLA
jgi:hypothetical protein